MLFMNGSSLSGLNPSAVEGFSRFLSEVVSILPLVAEGSGPFGFDTSIEGMMSQQFSVGIFYFLVTAILIFTVFIFVFMFKGKGAKLKVGEKILFGWLLLGVLVAVGFGAAQLLHGYLF